MFSRFVPIVAAAALLLSGCGSQGGDGEKAPVVLAASSMQEALEDAATAWAAEGHARPVLSFAASSALARQIESGAPGDIFISADQDWMDQLQRQDLLRPGTRRPILGNSLVLIAPADGDARILTDDDLEDLPQILGNGRLAMGDPSGVPAGRYGKAALEALDLWPALENRVAPAENVRAALALVERGAAPYGIVYGTDAAASKAVRVVYTFPEESHPAIRYPVAVLARSDSPDAQAFVTWLAGPQAFEIFARHGFTHPSPGA